MKRLWIGSYGISFRFSWRCSYIGFSWDKNERAFWILPLPFCALSIEFPQRKEYFRHGGYASGKMLKAKLECGNDHVCFPMKAHEFNLKVGSLQTKVQMSEEDLAEWKKLSSQPSKVVLVPKEQLMRIQNTDLCGPIDAHEIDYAKKQGIILHGWTGEKCPSCLGYGERNSSKPGYFGETLKCEECGGTGDEYGELKAK